MARRRRGVAVHGWIALYKESGFSSSQAVQKLLYLTGAAKGGHGGTLDPFAEGVLPVALGEATKTVSFVLEGDKHYQCWIQFGTETDTDDWTGTVTIQSQDQGQQQPERRVIEQVLHQFTGTIEQQVPLYSAVHIDGERAYRRARRGEVVSMPVRQVRIDRLSLLDYDANSGLACLDVVCSSGTYIRALSRAIGRAIGTPCHLRRLVRSGTFGFTLSQTLTLSQIEQKMQQGSLQEMVLPVDYVLTGMPALQLLPDDWHSIKNGREVSLRASGLPEGVTAGMAVRLMTPDGVFAAVATLLAGDGQNGSYRCVPKRLFNLSDRVHELS
ncbi:MAG: tRNA pseudouridine(55) synthase TruB [Magnetococcales bacterium]|nr:tRNA pseudouridine(55) synthase TruB [Magnetococcales bacterium]